MSTSPPGGGKLTRQDINKYLMELGYLDEEGKRIRPLDRDVVERLIEMNISSQGLDLSGRDLSGADLSDTRLRGADLINANLGGANLWDANLSDADLGGAILRFANLTDANLIIADLSGANLEGAILRREQLSEEQRSAIRGEPRYPEDREFSQATQGASPGAKVGPGAQPPPIPSEPLPGRTFATNDEFDGKDRLDMEKYARALARMVLMAESKPPLTIGIYGEWGSGKSALMHLIRKELENEQKARNLPLLSVEFNAWEHAGNEQKLWAGLSQAIVAAMDKRTGRRRRFRYGLRNNLFYVWRSLKRRWPVTLVGGAGLTTIVCAHAWAGTPETLSWALTGLGALFGSPSLVETWKNGMGPALSRPASSRLTMLLEEADSVEASDPVIQSVGNILKKLELALPDEYDSKERPVGAWPGASAAAASGDGKPPLKTVVFIDDLDRCPPDKVVDVLEGVKLILKDKQFVVFLAVDTRIVSKAIEHRYRDILETNQNGYRGELGMEYLAKIVQIPFLLPRPGKPQLLKLVIGRQRESLQPAGGQGSRDENSRPAGPRDGASEASPDSRGSFRASAMERLKRFVNRLRRQSDDQQPGPTRTSRGERNGDSVSTNGIPDDSREWETLALDDNDTETLVELAHQFTRNPRTYNRLGNELRILQFLLHQDGRANDWDEQKRKQMIKWLVLCDLWPAFGQYLVHDGGVTDAEQKATEDNRLLEVSKFPEVERLLSRRYDQASISQLREFLSQSPPLSVETAKELLPFTTNLTGIYE